MNIISLLIVLIILLWSCSKSNHDIGSKRSLTTSYDIKIKYQDDSDWSGHNVFDEYISPDSLYIFVETHFEKNLISIYLDGKLMKVDTVTTDGRVGLANDYVFGPFDKINSFGIRIDNGSLLFAEVGKSDNI